MKQYYSKKLIYKFLPLLREHIENIVGASEGIQHHRDFLYLQEQIASVTKANISVVTLKRLWGYIHYTGIPQIQTLDLLANFAGYTNWYHFIYHQQKSQKRYITFKKGIFIFGGIILLLGIIWLVLKKNVPSYTYDVEFRNKEYPAALTVNYQIPTKQKKPFYCKISFENKKISLKPHRSQFNKKIYHPGYFIISLYYKDLMLQQDTLFVSTHGWVLHENLTKANFEYSLDVKKQNGWLFNLPSDLTNKATDHILYYTERNTTFSKFTFETRFKLSFQDDKNKYHKATIGLDFHKGMIDLGFVNQGFTTSAHLMLGKPEQTLSGSYGDLSFMEINKNQVYDLTIQLQNQQISVWLNQDKIFEKPLQNKLGTFEGFNCHSADTLALDYIKFRSGKRILYEDDFNRTSE